MTAAGSAGPDGQPVHAAGGIVWRTTGAGEVEVVLVHRPKYDDWTIPKGKLLPGETSEDGALREVEEETGLRCALGRELASTSYVDAEGRPKIVRYWAMEPTDGVFRATREVDASRWLTLADAAGLLSYGRDRAVLDSFAR